MNKKIQSTSKKKYNATKKKKDWKKWVMEIPEGRWNNPSSNQKIIFK
jgi:hypothetical protein